MANYTLTYSENSNGWPSFYSYVPEYMIGMNNYFYSFSGGNMYRHNTNAVRNNYYGVQSYSSMSSVFNEHPLETKLFKTLNLESDQAWDATLTTDIPNEGTIDSAWFEKKEGSWYSFIRSIGETPANTEEYALRSLNGIAQSTSVTGTAAAPIVNFANTIDIGSIISVGDIIYHAIPPYTLPQVGGQITNVEVDLANSINRLTLDATITGAAAFTLQDPFILYIKNQTAESHGVLGHYCEFTLKNFSTAATELFVVESDVMKSYP